MDPAELEIENRRRQLRKWIDANYANPNAFAVKHGLNQGEISSLLKKKSFGSRRARNLEQQTGMPFQYLEQKDEAVHTVPITSGQREASNVEPGPDLRGKVPVISWVQAGNWCEAIDNLAPGDAEEWLYVPGPHGPNTFALRVQGLSMAPKYNPNDIIFVDPDVDPINGKNVVARLNDSDQVTFKQLVVEGNLMYLRPLNPDWPGDKIIQLPADSKICGVVIGKYVPD